MKKFLIVTAIQCVIFTILLASIISCSLSNNDCGPYNDIPYTNFPVDCYYTIKSMPFEPTIITFDSQKKFDTFFYQGSKTPCQDTLVGSRFIDFSKNILIGFFAGQKPTSGYDIKVSSVVTNECEDVVQYYEKEPGDDDDVVLGTTNPYDFVVIPKSEKKVYFNKVEPDND